MYVSNVNRNAPLPVAVAMVAAPPGPPNPPNWQAFWTGAGQTGNFNGAGPGVNFIIPLADMQWIATLTVQFTPNSPVNPGETMQVDLQDPNLVVAPSGNPIPQVLTAGTQVFCNFL